MVRSTEKLALDLAAKMMVILTRVLTTPVMMTRKRAAIRTVMPLRRSINPARQLLKRPLRRRGEKRKKDKKRRTQREDARRRNRERKRKKREESKRKEKERREKSLRESKEKKMKG